MLTGTLDAQNTDLLDLDGSIYYQTSLKNEKSENLNDVPQS